MCLMRLVWCYLFLHQSDNLVWDSIADPFATHCHRCFIIFSQCLLLRPLTIMMSRLQRCIRLCCLLLGFQIMQIAYELWILLLGGVKVANPGLQTLPLSVDFLMVTFAWFSHLDISWLIHILPLPRVADVCPHKSQCLTFFGVGPETPDFLFFLLQHLWGFLGACYGKLFWLFWIQLVRIFSWVCYLGTMDSMEGTKP